MKQTSLSRDEMYQEGRKILLGEGFTTEEIDNTDSSLVITSYMHREYMEGRMTMEIDATIILESGESVEGRPVQAYIHESYEEALKRELDEKGESYDPDDILKAAVAVITE
jgi:hypothetical protein